MLMPVLLFILAVNFFSVSEAVQCFQCNDETCGRPDTTGKCTGPACFKTSTFDKSQSKDILLKGCLKSNQAAPLTDTCSEEKLKLSGGMSIAKKCFCKSQDFCNEAKSLLSSNNFQQFCSTMILSIFVVLIFVY